MNGAALWAAGVMLHCEGVRAAPASTLDRGMAAGVYDDARRLLRDCYGAEARVVVRGPRVAVRYRDAHSRRWRTVGLGVLRAGGQA